MNLETYYDQSVFDEYIPYDIILKDASFNWGKVLSSEQIEKIHAVKRKLIKNKGKRKDGAKSDQAQNADLDVQARFYLNNLNLSIKKVGRPFCSYYQMLQYQILLFSFTSNTNVITLMNCSSNRYYELQLICFRENLLALLAQSVVESRHFCLPL